MVTIMSKINLLFAARSIFFWKRSAVCAGLLISLLWIATPAGAQSSNTYCRRVTFQNQIHWATSGAWSEDGMSVLVVDAYQDEILGVSRSNGTVSSWAETASLLGASALQDQLQKPRQIRPLGEGWLLLDKRETANLLSLNKLLDPTGSIVVQNRSLRGAGNLGEEIELNWIYDFASMGQGILAFADIIDSDGTDQGAFLYFEDSGLQQIFGRIRNDALVTFLYVRNMRYLAAIGKDGYILRLDGSARSTGPVVVKVRFGESKPDELEFFPEQFRKIPDLKNLPSRGPRKATVIYEREEAVAMAAGLYAWDHYLYLLGKEAIGQNRETTWWLVKLDPRDGTELARARLPTGAAHLTVVPGSDFWALIEKAPVEGVGRMHAPFMDHPSMVLVPTSWLESPSSSPLADGQVVECSLLGQ